MSARAFQLELILAALQMERESFVCDELYSLLLRIIYCASAEKFKVTSPDSAYNFNIDEDVRTAEVAASLSQADGQGRVINALTWQHYLAEVYIICHVLII